MNRNASLPEKFAALTDKQQSFVKAVICKVIQNYHLDAIACQDLANFVALELRMNAPQFNYTPVISNLQPACWEMETQGVLIREEINYTMTLRLA